MKMIDHSFPALSLPPSLSVPNLSPPPLSLIIAIYPPLPPLSPLPTSRSVFYRLQVTSHASSGLSNKRVRMMFMDETRVFSFKQRYACSVLLFNSLDIETRFPGGWLSTAHVSSPQPRRFAGTPPEPPTAGRTVKPPQTSPSPAAPSPPRLHSPLQQFS